jgi:hypothetical protein
MLIALLQLPKPTGYRATHAGDYSEQALFSPEGCEILGVKLQHVILNPDKFVPQRIVSDQMLSQDLLSATGLPKTGDILKHVGADLSIRCWQSYPSNAGKEGSKRELISPIIFAAAVLAGKTGVLKVPLLSNDALGMAWHP